ncbi:MAG: diphosphomevalonate decarboxylase [Bradymonadia bacterium]|jgi:diphosphomevalonate decarboxylase
MTATTAVAHPNIALVKYWGKRERTLNLPAAGSFSLTLGPVRSTTSVEWGQAADSFTLDGEDQGVAELQKLTTFLDLVRDLKGGLGGGRVVSSNDFPTAAGLASSASGFAALATATCAAAGLELASNKLSELARRGSGSAARSVFGGFVRMRAGVAVDGSDAVAEQVAPAEHWPLHMLLCVTAEGRKSVSSRVGMNRTQETSPYFDAWIGTVEPAVEAAIEAVKSKDFERLANVAEASALQMHASGIAAVPGVLYWNGTTVTLIHEVRRWRADGLPVFFTIDAGPHVKICVPADRADEVAKLAADVPGVVRVLHTQAAGGPEVLS